MSAAHSGEDMDPLSVVTKELTAAETADVGVGDKAGSFYRSEVQVPAEVSTFNTNSRIEAVVGNKLTSTEMGPLEVIADGLWDADVGDEVAPTEKDIEAGVQGKITRVQDLYRSLTSLQGLMFLRGWNM